jgi:deoxyadenosine kinase
MTDSRIAYLSEPSDDELPPLEEVGAPSYRNYDAPFCAEDPSAAARIIMHPRETYGATFAPPNVVVGIAGIIGAGKSTLASALATRLGWDCIDEPVSNNPYLADFYKDKAKYGFAMQIFLLHHRFRQHQSMVWGKRSAIQDRTIYEDVIFAKMLHESGDISDRDFETYCSAFANMSNFLHRPDIIVYLDVTPEVAHDRVVARARGCEQGLVPIEYLRALRDGYEDWLASGIRGRIPVLRIDWSGAASDANIASVAEKINAICTETHSTFIV